MYPTLILILVALQQSRLEYEFKESDDSAGTGPMRFAPAILSRQTVSNVSTDENMVVSIPGVQCVTITEIVYEPSSKSGSSETLKNKDEIFSREGKWC